MASEYKIAFSDNWVDHCYTIPNEVISQEQLSSLTLNDIYQDISRYCNRVKNKIFPAIYSPKYLPQFSPYSTGDVNNWLRGHIYMQNILDYSYPDLFTGIFNNGLGIYHVRMQYLNNKVKATWTTVLKY